MNTQPTTWRRRRMFPIGEKRLNPLFPQRRSRSPHLPLFLLVGGLGLSVVFLALTNPVLALEYVLVEGNHFIKLGMIDNLLHQYLDQSWLGIFSQANYFLFRSNQAEDFVQSGMNAVQAIEKISITKQFPASLVIQIKERIPNFVYTNGGQSFLVDRAGFVASAVSAKTTLDKNFPKLIDQTSRLITVGASAIPEEKVAFLFQVHEALSKEKSLTVDFYYLPPQTCLDLTQPAPPQEEPSTVLKNDNTNQEIKQDDQPQKKQTKTGVTENSNTNRSPRVLPEDLCDPAELALKSREIRAKTAEGWEIYFRLDDGAEEQVARLFRVLNERKPDRLQLQYVDLRFGEYVVLK